MKISPKLTENNNMEKKGCVLPLVSIGIPTYNRPGGLRRTLECITEQTYKNLEIIVSDNCSSGIETEAVVREFMLKDSRIKNHRQVRNMGATFNIKFVLEKSKGKYFMWAADDDEWDSMFIESLVGILESHNNISVAMCQTRYKLDEIKIIPILQGVTLNSQHSKSLKIRLLQAVQLNFGEMFYGIFRKNCLISEKATIDFEKGGVIHAVMKAMINGDAYVSREFKFTKKVTEDAFLWTYLCAKKKSTLATNKYIEKMLIEHKYQRRKLYSETTMRSMFKLMLSLLYSTHFHILFLLSSVKTIKNLKFSHRIRAGFVILNLNLLTRSLGWSFYQIIKWNFY